MKTAIKLNTKVKSDNPEMFEGRSVGDIFEMAIPQTFVRDVDIEVETTNDEGETVTVTETKPAIISRYDIKTEHHQADGFAEIVEPENFNAETHKKGNLIEDGNTFTFETIAYTQAEIEANKDAKIPKQVPKLYFKMQLLDLGVNDDDIQTLIDNISDQKEKYKLRYMWFENSIVERNNPYLYSLLPALNQLKKSQNANWVDLTDQNIIDIFKNYQV